MYLAFCFICFEWISRLLTLFAQFNVAVEGRVYSSLFQVKQYPHVAILDPFTGKVVWRKEGWTPGHANELTADTFAEAIVSLPDLEESKAARACLSRSNSAVFSEGEKSWELLSLLETWERLSIGASGGAASVDGDSASVATCGDAVMVDFGDLKELP